MLLNEIINISWIIILITIAILTIIFVSTKYFLPVYKMKISEVSFLELLQALNAIVQTELDIWENNVFEDKGALTNSNFENYYDEISVHIIKSLSPTFFLNIGKYLSEDAVVSIIGRKVREYLVSKIK